MSDKPRFRTRDLVLRCSGVEGRLVWYFVLGEPVVHRPAEARLRRLFRTWELFHWIEIFDFECLILLCRLKSSPKVYLFMSLKCCHFVYCYQLFSYCHFHLLRSLPPSFNFHSKILTNILYKSIYIHSSIHTTVGRPQSELVPMCLRVGIRREVEKKECLVEEVGIL